MTNKSTTPESFVYDGSLIIELSGESVSYALNIPEPRGNGLGDRLIKHIWPDVKFFSTTKKMLIPHARVIIEFLEEVESVSADDE